MKHMIRFITCLLLLVSCSTNEKDIQGSASKDVKPGAAVVLKKTILFFGNSLTAGYGLSPDEAFPALIQHKIDSLGLLYNVINAGVSGETSSGGNSRIDWILRQKVDVFVLELGANDGLRGIPITQTKQSLQAIIDKVKLKYPDVIIILAGMQIPPNMGKTYTAAFKAMFPELAKTNNATLIPFILDGVGGEARLNQQDGIHPTAEGHRIICENIWRILKGLI